ncbi:MAG TPA: response regulator [Pyrinomonadaceae bacterium]|nr:response regulator [Pyrinomonadaceae bacterium]
MLPGRRKLLVADDSPTVRKVVSLTFSDEGLEVVVAEDGEQALRLLEGQEPPDILLADVTMPGPDGYALCERVKRDARLAHIPVVLLVGTFEPFNEAEARRVGADTVLTKPFQSIRDLVSKVGSLLGGEGKHEEHEPAREEAPPRREPAEEVMTREADIPVARREPAAEPERAEAPAPAAFESFDMDDELIEATPAESFGGAQDQTRAAAAGAQQQPAARASAPSGPLSFDEPRGQFDDAASAPFGSVVLEPVASHTAARETEPAFSSRAADASAADDALLDLGGIEPPASAASAEADDFILDLGDDFAPEPPPARPDAPSAFAEAAHGERAPVFDAPAFDEPAEEVVAQDEPFVFEGQADVQQDSGSAPRGLIEPEVVPADEPVPATVESPFTDGSVEGDVPKPPAAAEAHEDFGHAAQPSFAGQSSASPAEPSTAGFAVGEARVGLEEPVRGDQLSKEMIDAIARRVVELMSDKVVREIAWEVVPELAELHVKQRLEGKK